MENRFTTIMEERSNEELMEILLRKRNDYQSEAVDAARKELGRRNLSPEQIEEITDLIQQREELERDQLETQHSWFESCRNYVRIPSNLPFSIKLGAWLIYLSLFLDIIRVILLNRQGIVHSLIDGPTVLILAGYLLIGYMIHTGKNWARLFFVSLLLIHLVLYPFYIGSSFETDITLGIIISTAFAARISALVLLFVYNSRKWYRKRYGCIASLQNIEMRRSILALVITLLFGAYMFRPVIVFFYELKAYSLWITLLVILGDMLLLFLIFFLWYGYLRREFSKGNC
ncbi:MAG: hypothetical protein ACLFM7_09565 [Bacteroidales bacterium]